MQPRVKLRIRRKKGVVPWPLLIISAALLTAVGAHHRQPLGFHAMASGRPGPTTVRKPMFTHPQGPVLPQTAVNSTLPFTIGENSGVLWNLTTGQLLWAYQPYLREPYASTTKLMTIYLAMKDLPLHAMVSISPQAAATTGSDIRMAVGYRFTVRQLLFALMMDSANDASVALAQTDAGSVAAFVAKMNHTAAMMGMAGTTYVDPDGLAAGSAGNAWDLSIIARADMRNSLFRQIVRTKESSLPHNPVLRNLNGLLFMDPTVIGVKTGWTTEAGFNLVFAATRKVHGTPVTLLGVIMHGQNGFPPEYQDAENILNWAYHNLAHAPSTSQ